MPPPGQPASCPHKGAQQCLRPQKHTDGSRVALLERGRHRQPAGEFTNLLMSRYIKKSGAVTHWSAFLASL